MRCLFLFALVFACGARERAPLPAREPLRGAVAAPTPSSAPPTSPPARVVFEALAAIPAPNPFPSIEIVEPAFGDRLDPALARNRAVNLRVENWPLAREGAGVLVALDGQRPRRFLNERALSLADLLPDDAELARGPHFLLAVAVDAAGRSVRAESPAGKRALAHVGFFVGTAQGELRESEGIFCLSPSGTVYENPGAAVPFEALALDDKLAFVAVEIRLPDANEEHLVDPRRAYALRGLPLGDVSFSLGERGRTRAACSVTLNPALPERARP